MEIERFIKFLGVILDECISWEGHIRTLYRAKQLLNTSSLKSIYLSYIHSYLNYTNIARNML